MLNGRPGAVLILESLYYRSSHERGTTFEVILLGAQRRLRLRVVAWSCRLGRVEMPMFPRMFEVLENTEDEGVAIGPSFKHLFIAEFIVNRIG